MKNTFRRTRLATALSGVALTLGAGQAWGAAFALAEQNAMGLGNAFAGAAATAEDSNTVWHNPAGLARLLFPGVTAAAHVIIPSSKFQNQGSQAALGQPLGGTGGDAGDVAVVPNFYASMPITDAWRVGIGVNVPFGLKTEYDDGWLGRYQALKSEVKTININPAVAWKATPDFWLGAGASYQQFKATLTNNVNYTGALAQGYAAAAAGGLIPATSIPSLIGATSGLDSFVSTTGQDWSWGWNVGAMYSIGGSANDDNGAARLGAAYRSKIKFNVTGNVGITNPTPPTLSGALAPFNPVVEGVANTINATRRYNGGVALDVTVPDSASFSYYQRLNDTWDLLADVTWTGWSSIQQLAITRTSGLATGSSTVLPFNYRDTWRASVGTNYRYGEKWVFRAGVAWDQTPVNEADMSARLPDGDRTWLAGGARWKYSREINFDLAAAYIWVKDPSINNAGNPASVAANGLISGNYSSSVWIISAEMNYRFR